MTTISVTFCDYCNKNQSMKDMGGRGYLMWSEEVAIESFDWLKTDDGIMCIECQDEREL